MKSLTTRAYRRVMRRGLAALKKLFPDLPSPAAVQIAFYAPGLKRGYRMAWCPRCHRRWRWDGQGSSCLRCRAELRAIFFPKDPKHQPHKHHGTRNRQ